MPVFTAVLLLAEYLNPIEHAVGPFRTDSNIGTTLTEMRPRRLSDGPNWMSSIDSELALSEVSIPGSHDSCALYEPYPGSATCQTAALSAQLSMGVRFLDVRCKNDGKKFDIYHGPIGEKTTFDQVLSDTSSFLSNNPTETVIMSVKEENSKTGDSFESVFRNYVARNPTIWSLDSHIPKLKAVRGKIILLRRFKGSIGIDGTDWPDNRTFLKGNLDVEDLYNVSKPQLKWDAVLKHLDAAPLGSPSSIFMTFTSGYVPGFFGIPNITDVASLVNQSLAKYFKSAKAGRYGIIPMDFVAEDTCSHIIATNKGM